MKLKNFMFATMIACAFASCSEDDVPTPGTEPGVEADATLSLQVLGSVDTKSNPFTGTGVTDSTITSLTAYVFRIGADGSTYVFETSQSATAAEIPGKKVEQIPVAAGMKKVVVLANATASNLTAGTSTLVNLCAQNLTYPTSENAGLSMNSAVYDLYVKAGNENCLGYGANKPAGAIDATVSAESTTAVATSPIYLYRNVAKVVLSEVKMKKEKYPNAALQIDSVYILHARKHSKIAFNNSTSGQGWGETAVTVADAANYLNGVSGASYLKWANFMTGKDKVKDYFTTATNNYEAGAITSLGDAVSGFTANKITSVSKVDSFYVYENPAVQGGDTTLLVVVGKFYPDGNTDATNVDYSYYTIGVGTDGLGTATKPAGTLVNRDVKGVLRNLEYKISLTVNGPGYETPFGPKLDDYTFLDVQCVVAPFGSADQSWEI